MAKKKAPPPRSNKKAAPAKTRKPVPPMKKKTKLPTLGGGLLGLGGTGAGGMMP